MTLTTHMAKEQTVKLGELSVSLQTGGTGIPLLVLHRDIGSPGWLPFHDALAAAATVYLPDQPGFGKSDRPDWARDVRDLASLNLWLLQELGAQQADVVGLGFGGWIAAEMATMAHKSIRKLVLVSPAGIQPQQGEIVDQFLMSSRNYVKSMFADEKNYNQLYGSEPSIDQMEAWEIAREMTTRVAWKPYMFNRRLPVLLGGFKNPALIIWGKQDKVIPPVCGEQYKAALPNARLETLENCGHCAEIDQTKETAALITKFLAA